MNAMAMSVVQVSMEVWAFPCPDADDDFHECGDFFVFFVLNRFFYVFFIL